MWARSWTRVPRVVLAGAVMLIVGCSSPSSSPSSDGSTAPVTSTIARLSVEQPVADTDRAAVAHPVADAAAVADTTTAGVIVPTTSPSVPASFEDAWRPTIDGLLTFRGNTNRRFYGRGPVPVLPSVSWSYPKNGAMCRNSSAKGVTKQWCGAGWTGQPTVHVRDGRTWVVFNAYDGAVHFVDGTTGEDILEPFPTGDIIKGTVTIDPDGFPLVYSGSRDNYFRVLAIDRGPKAVELWRLGADDVSPTLWNNDWDGSALVLDDWLLEGGENSQFHAVKLGRSRDANGLVQVDPKLVFNTPGWDDQLRADLAGQSSSEVSIENSVAVDGDTVYFGNSGGLIQGWDLAPLRTGGTPLRTFRYWVGDDTDASVVIDDDGALYVGVEFERGNVRSREVGQLVKLNPTRPSDPLVWSFFDDARRPGGIWSTVALHDGVVIATTDGGRVVGLDQRDGAVLWELRLPGPLWSSPVVVDDVLIQGDCGGVLHGFDVSDARAEPRPSWAVELGGCIEATPAVWDGVIYVSTRGGRFFALR